MTNAKIHNQFLGLTAASLREGLANGKTMRGKKVVRVAAPTVLSHLRARLAEGKLKDDSPLMKLLKELEAKPAPIVKAAPQPNVVHDAPDSTESAEAEVIATVEALMACGVKPSQAAKAAITKWLLTSL